MKILKELPKQKKHFDPTNNIVTIGAFTVFIILFGLMSL